MPDPNYEPRGGYSILIAILVVGGICLATKVIEVPFL